HALDRDRADVCRDEVADLPLTGAVLAPEVHVEARYIARRSFGRSVAEPDRPARLAHGRRRVRGDVRGDVGGDFRGDVDTGRGRCALLAPDLPELFLGRWSRCRRRRRFRAGGPLGTTLLGADGALRPVPALTAFAARPAIESAAARATARA